MTTPRVPPLNVDALSDEEQKVLQPILDAGRPWNIFLTLAHHPDLMKRWLVFSNHVLFKSTIPAREREIAILRTGWLCQSEYEWAQHEVIGTAAGLTADEVQRIKEGSEAEWSELDRLILIATDELYHDKKISDATWIALTSHWNDQQMMDLVFAIGQYTLVSMALRTFGVPLDDFLTGWDPT
jgi:4-carboxymuconolactone decarboxylase